MLDLLNEMPLIQNSHLGDTQNQIKLQNTSINSAYLGTIQSEKTTNV